MIDKDLKKIKWEFILPVLAGLFCSLFLCAFTGYSFGFYEQPAEEPQIIRSPEENFEFLFSANNNIQDTILEYFGNPEYKDWVVDFFTGICLDRAVSIAILENSKKYEVSPALAFALCWEESRFNAQAVNRFNRDGSIDRGLFQLNNRSFPNLEPFVFFDINTNVYYGISHLRHCLNVGGSEISALAMYNAGTGRVRTTGAPEVTLNYISRILNNKSKIESLFHSRLIKEEERRMKEENEEKASQLFFNRALIN